MKSQFNEMIILAEDKKTKSNSDVASVLGLMKDLLDFQDKVDKCAEAQVSPKNQQVIESFDDVLIKMYKELGVIAESAIYKMKDESIGDAEVEVEETEIEGSEGAVIEKSDIDKSETKLTPPVIPTM